MDDNNTDQQRTTTENMAIAEKLPMPDITPFQCPKCPKSFLSKQGLNMHNMRVHTKVLGTGYNWKGKRKQSKDFPSNDLATRRRKYRETRDENLKMGLTAKGLRFKNKGAWHRQMMMRGLPLHKPIGTDPRKWTPERTAKFKRTMKLRAMEKATRTGKPVRFVYPVPEEAPVAAAVLSDLGKETPLTEWLHAQLHFCPKCGEHLTKWKKE